MSDWFDDIKRIIGLSGNIAEVTAENRLKVDVNVQTPANKTPVVINAYSELTVTTDTYYVIPNGATLTITSLEGGAPVSTQGSAVGLYYQPNGNATNEVMITTPIICVGNTFQKQISWTCPDAGNGTRRIALRRIRYESVSRFVSAEFRGYY